MENTKQTISEVLNRTEEKPKKDIFKIVSLAVLAILTVPVLFAAISSVAFADTKSQFVEKLKLDENNYSYALKNLESARCSLAATKLLAYANDALSIDSAEVKRLSDLKASCGGF